MEPINSSPRVPAERTGREERESTAPGSVEQGSMAGRQIVQESTDIRYLFPHSTIMQNILEYIPDPTILMRVSRSVRDVVHENITQNSQRHMPIEFSREATSPSNPRLQSVEKIELLL